MTTYYRQTAKFSIKQNVVVYLKIVVYSLLLLEIVNLTIICSTFYQNCDVGVRAEHAILAGAGAESRARLEVLKRSAGALFGLPQRSVEHFGASSAERPRSTSRSFFGLLTQSCM